MPTLKVRFEVKTKRPLDATPSKALQLHRAGMSQRELARFWNISQTRVWQLIRQGRKLEELKANV